MGVVGSENNRVGVVFIIFLCIGDMSSFSEKLDGVWYLEWGELGFRV